MKCNHIKSMWSKMKCVSNISNLNMQTNEL